MKKLYIDCSAGISGDMMCTCLREIVRQSIDGRKSHNDGEKGNKIFGGFAGAEKDGEQHGGNVDRHGVRDGHSSKNHHNSEHHGRSYSEVKEMIATSDATENAKVFALNIYEAIAKAEAQVHDKTLEKVHFHEVGREEAVANAIEIGKLLDVLGCIAKPDVTLFYGSSEGDIEPEKLEIVISPIYDGTGFIDCAHGRIPVPVPAVEAMKTQCPEYEFCVADNVKTEMVTPSGLAALIGIGARPANSAEKNIIDACFGQMQPSEGIAASDSETAIEELRCKSKITPDNNCEGILAFAEAKGSRNTGRGGLRMILCR